MADQPEIELELDDVFPPPSSHSLILARPPKRPPRRTLPPPPPMPQLGGAMDRLQEDVNLVIDATSERLDAMERRQDEFEHTMRGVSGARESRVRDLEERVERTQRMMLELTRKLREARDLLDEHQHGIDEMRARTTLAVAKIDQIRASSPDSLLESDTRSCRNEPEPTGDAEPTMRVVRS